MAEQTIGTSIRATLGDLWRDGRGWILLAVSAGWLLSMGARYAYPTLLPYFRSAFGLSNTLAGLLLTVMWLAYALGQFPGGILGDVLGEGRVLVTSTFLSLAALAVVTVAGVPLVLYVATVAFGFATALYGPTRFTILTDIYTDRAGTAVGVTMAAGSLGNAVIPVFVGLFAASVAWQFGLWALLPAFLVVGVVMWLVVPTRTSTGKSADDALSAEAITDLAAGIRESGVLVLLVVQICGMFVAQGFLGFYPTYLIDVKGFSPPVAATLFGLYFATGVVMQLLAGVSKDTFGTRRSLTTIFGMYFTGLLALAVVDGLLAIAVLTVWLSAKSGTGVVSNTYISEVLPASVKGSGLGLLRTVWFLIGATSPVLVGFLADAGYFWEAFLVLAGIAGLAMVVTFFLPSPGDPVDADGA